MSLESIALTGLQAVLGLVGLTVGAAKVTHQEDQVEDFQRFGYPRWFRILTGLIEIGAGVALLAGLVWLSEFTVAGGILMSSVMVGAVATHVRTGDSLSQTAVPAVLFALTAGLLTLRTVTIPL